jgi:hypothetical protein
MLILVTFKKNNIVRSIRFLCVATVWVLCLFMNSASGQNQGIETPPVDSTKSSGPGQTELAVDEGIKCTRAELVDRKFVTTGKSKYGEILRITYQDLERGGREILFQKKLMENDAVEFYMPFETVKEAKTAVLVVMKGDGMFFKKIDITD